MGRKGKFSNARELQESETVNAPYLGYCWFTASAAQKKKLSYKDHLP